MRAETIFAAKRTLFGVFGLPSFFLIFLAGCASSNHDGAKSFAPTPFGNEAAGDAATRSPSAMEALSRGVAAVTPPGAPLKDIYYDFDSTDLQTTAKEILEQNAQWMRAHPQARVEVEGHCDDIGSAEYNLALGAKRAAIAKQFLVDQGISAERLVTISYGKEAPACFEPNEACRVKNRRARFIIFTEIPTS